MALTLTAPALTVKDYLSLPESHPRCELIEGEIHIIPSPNEFHQQASFRLNIFVGNYLEEHQVGSAFTAPFDVFLEEFTAVQPDLLFVANNNPDAWIDGGVYGVPDFIVEILSPSNAARDLTAKRRLYREHLVKEIWFVDTEQKLIAVDRLGSEGEGYQPERIYQAGETLTTPLLPDFELEVARLFVQPWRRDIQPDSFTP